MSTDRVSRKEDVHVMPEYEDHESTPSCRCIPYVEYENAETGGRVWVHRESN